MNTQLPYDATILLDSNLAILLCVGLSGTHNISKHKRLTGYDHIDFDLICGLIRDDTKLVFSPYVLSETSYLVRQVANPLKNELSLILKLLILRADEIQQKCSDIVEHSQYLRLGMTDAALLSILEA